MGQSKSGESGSLRGADRLAAAMDNAGVKTVFSLSGNQIMPVYDALIDFNIRIIHTRHEAAAVFMAEAYSQIGDTIGVALVTAGPGFANALGALFSARMSETPLILLSGDSPTSLDGHGAFQEMDQSTVVSNFVKDTFRLAPGDDPTVVFARAKNIATAGTPGPVHIALPFDLLNCTDTPDETVPEDAASELASSASTELSKHQASQLVDHIRSAQKPIVLVGPYLSRGERFKLLRQFEQASAIPVIVLDSPRGLRDPSSGAMPRVFAATDCVIYLGKPVDFTTGFADPAVMPEAKIAIIAASVQQLEHDRKRLGERLVFADVADSEQTLSLLIAEFEQPQVNEDFRDDWLLQVKSALGHRNLSDQSDAALFSKRIAEEINTAIHRAGERYPQSILICDGGEIGQWAQGFIQCRPRITNGPSGAIGGAIPYAIGAKIARPDALVIAILGDGTAGFHFAEYETLARESVGVVTIIGNDSRWNAEKQIQINNYGEARAVGCDLQTETRYDQAATGLGVEGALVVQLSDLADAMDQAIGKAMSESATTCVNILMPGAAAPVYRDFEI